MKIAIFDSGIGGVTVLKEFIHSLPEHDYLYFGDTANVPYGSKSPSHIKKLVTEASKKISRFKPDVLIVACNTASSIALNEFKKNMSAPVISVVDAGIASIKNESIRAPKKPILILGTSTTIKSRVYSKLLNKAKIKTKVLEQACPLLVPIIEQGWINHAVLKLTLKEYLKSHKAHGPGIALLGCTHYPWAQHEIQKQLKGWVILNSAISVLNLVRKQFNLPSTPKSKKSKSPPIKWYFSDPQSVPLALLGLKQNNIHPF